jgi:8-amino-7-oxononanoate synthase
MRRALAERLRALDERGLRRRALVAAQRSGPEVEVDGRIVVNLSSNDYLGLASDPEVAEAHARAALRLPAGAGAARLVTGTHPEHEALERELASFVGTERALVFGSGYLANAGVLAALGAQGGTILSDARNHASIVDGCRLARAGVRIYRHIDTDHLDARLSGAAGPRLVVTESVFSMDGDRSPLDRVLDAAARHDAWVYVDEAHAFGHLGPSGRGLSCDPAVFEGVDVRMGTLGKSLGCAGAFVAGSAELVDYLVSTARTFLYSTALPPAVAAAARAALEVVRGPRGEELRLRLARNTRALREGLREQGWEVMDVPGPILPIVVGNARRAVELSARLLERGVLVRAMRYPTVEEGTERLRMVASAALCDEHVERTLELMGALREEL